MMDFKGIWGAVILIVLVAVGVGLYTWFSKKYPTA